MYLILILLLILAVAGGAPHWGYHTYGWGPSGFGGLLLIVLLVLVLTRRL